MGSVEEDDNDLRLIGRLPGTANIDCGFSSWLDYSVVYKPILNDVMFRRRLGVSCVLFNEFVEDL